MTTGVQLPLAFEHRPALGGEDFLVAAGNRDAVRWLDRWPRWPGPVLVIHGPAGCGKTHLTQVFLEQSGGRRISPETLRQADPTALADGAPACVIDDAGDLPGHDEEALLHLHNALAAAGGHLLLTARHAPARWKVALADLASRLRAAAAVEIQPPDDALITAVLVKLFNDRQLKVDGEVLPYMLARMERSFAAARAIVAAVDAAALEQRRNITVPLVGQVLRHIDNEERGNRKWT